MKLVPDWTQAYKWYSVHGALAIAIASGAYALLPSLQAILPAKLYAVAMLICGLAIIVLRVIQQQTPPKLPDNQDGMD